MEGVIFYAYRLLLWMAFSQLTCHHLATATCVICSLFHSSYWLAMSHIYGITCYHWLSVLSEHRYLQWSFIIINSLVCGDIVDITSSMQMNFCGLSLVEWLATIWLLLLHVWFVFYFIQAFDCFLSIALYRVCNSKSFWLAISHILWSTTYLCLRVLFDIDTYMDFFLQCYWELTIQVSVGGKKAECRRPAEEHPHIVSLGKLQSHTLQIFFLQFWCKREGHSLIDNVEILNQCP